MKKSFKQDQRGIASIFLIIFLAVVLAGVGFVSYRAYSENNKANQKKTELRAPANKTAEAAACKELVTQYEKLKICYPADVQLVDKTAADESGTVPGIDHLRFTKGNYTLAIQAGLYGVGGACPECTVPLSEDVTVLGQALHLNYVSDNGQTVSSLLVAKDPATYLDFINTKNIKTNEGKSAYIGITITPTQPEATDAIKNNSDFKVLKKIVTDLKY